MKKILVAMLTIIMLLIGSAAMTYAAEGDLENGDLEKGVDFLITEKIEMTGTGTSPDLIITPLEVTAGERGIIIDSVRTEASRGWTLVKNSTDFSTLPINAKKFSLSADISGSKYDLSTSLAIGEKIRAEETTSISFSGKTGATDMEITDVHIGDVVVELSLASLSTTLISGPEFYDFISKPHSLASDNVGIGGGKPGGGSSGGGGGTTSALPSIVIFTDVVAPDSEATIDVSAEGDGGVVVWYEATTTEVTAYVSTQRPGVNITANADSSAMFTGSNKKIDFTNLDTSTAITASGMFDMCINLEEVTIGQNFAFIGTNAYLPAQTDESVSGADGKWYNRKGVGFAPADIPSKVADTYKAVAPPTPVTLHFMDGVSADKETNTADPLFQTPKREGYVFDGWYYGTVTLALPIDTFTNPNTSRSWSKDTDGVWTAQIGSGTISTFKMISNVFTVEENSRELSFDWKYSYEAPESFKILGYDILNVDTGQYLSGQTTPTTDKCIKSCAEPSSDFASESYTLAPGNYQLLFMCRNGGTVFIKTAGYVKNVKLAETFTYGEKLTGEPPANADLYAKWTAVTP